MSNPSHETYGVVNPELATKFALLGAHTVRAMAYAYLALNPGFRTPIEVGDGLLQDIQTTSKERFRFGETIRQQLDNNLVPASLAVTEREPVSRVGGRERTVYAATTENRQEHLTMAGAALAWRLGAYQSGVEINLDSIWGRITDDPRRSPAVARLAILGALAHAGEGGLSETDLIEATHGTHGKVAVHKNIGTLAAERLIDARTVFDIRTREIVITVTPEHLEVRGSRMGPITRALYETALGLLAENPQNPRISAAFLIEQTVARHPHLSAEEVQKTLLDNRPQGLQFADNDPIHKGSKTRHTLAQEYKRPIEELFTLLTGLENPDFTRQVRGRLQQILDTPQFVATLLSRAGFAVTA